MMKAKRIHLNLVVFFLSCFLTGGCNNTAPQRGADSSLDRNLSLYEKIKQQYKTPKHDATIKNPKSTQKPDVAPPTQLDQQTFESGVKHDKHRDTNIIAIPRYAGAMTGHWISQVLSNGKYIVLEDNSLWEINSIDTFNTALWLPISNVVIVEKVYQGFIFYDIINIDDSEKATANFLGTVQLQTQIDGDFKGWDGDTVFVLSNGNILKQASYAYTYHYAYRPRVLVYLRGSYYYLLVDGVEESIMVYVIK